MKFDARVTEKGEGLKDVLNALEKAVRADILVGVPQNAKPRTNDDKMTEPLLMYIHSEGSPARGLPARPAIQIGIEKNKQEIAKRLKGILKDGLDKKDIRYLQYALGAFAVEKVVSTFGSDDLAPLKKATIKRKAKKITKGETRLVVLSNGRVEKIRLSAKERQAEFIMTTNGDPLDDTGQLKRSITYKIEKVTKK
jgi:hypothetical protein